MDESSRKDTKEQEKSSGIDLSELSSFSFGTQWSESAQTSKGGGSKKQSFRGGPRGPRPERGSGQAAGQRRDRRPVRKSSSDREGGNASGGQGRERHGEGRGGYGRQHGGHRDQAPRPYESNIFAVGFYPDDASFTTIIKAMRSNHLTYELFEVSKIFLEKSDRYIASVTCKSTGEDKAPKVFMSIPDSMPFNNEDDAIYHALNHHADQYFTVEEVEVDPPSGNFQFVNRCRFTKVLLGPPNFHKYEEILKTHHRTRLANMPIDKVKASVETVREEEVINEWLESMKKTTRYTTKNPAEGEEPKSFDSLDDAFVYVKTAIKQKVVRAVSYARVSGAVVEKYKDTEAFKAIDGELQRQSRFPLDTANAIRGRMRREKFSIYKKGSKGVTYVCATKRNFRTPGQVMADSLDRLIRFLESNQGIKLSALGAKFEEWLKGDNPDVGYDEKKMLRDLHWLVADGYVSHFSDDTLHCQPILDNQPKEKEAKAPIAKEAAKPGSKSEAAPETTSETPAEPVAEAPDAPATAEVATPAESSAEVTSETPLAAEPEAESAKEESPVEEPVSAEESPETAPEPTVEPTAESKSDAEEKPDSEKAKSEA